MFCEKSLRKQEYKLNCFVPKKTEALQTEFSESRKKSFVDTLEMANGDITNLGCRVMSRMLRVYLRKNEDKSEKHICAVVQFCSRVVFILVCRIPTNLRAWSVFTLRTLQQYNVLFASLKTILHWWQTSTSKRQWVIMTWQHINNVSVLAGVNNH